MPDSSDYRTCYKCGTEVCLVVYGMEDADLFICNTPPFHVFCRVCHPEVKITEIEEDTREISGDKCPVCK